MKSDVSVNQAMSCAAAASMEEGVSSLPSTYLCQAAVVALNRRSSCTKSINVLGWPSHPFCGAASWKTAIVTGKRGSRVDVPKFGRRVYLGMRTWGGTGLTLSSMSSNLRAIRSAKSSCLWCSASSMLVGAVPRNRMHVLPVYMGLSSPSLLFLALRGEREVSSSSEEASFDDADGLPIETLAVSRSFWRVSSLKDFELGLSRSVRCSSIKSIRARALIEPVTPTPQTGQSVHGRLPRSRSKQGWHTRCPQGTQVVGGYTCLSKFVVHALHLNAFSPL